MSAGHKWRPLVQATHLKGASPELIAVAMEKFGCDRPTAIAKLNADAAQCKYWMNDLYQVEVRPHTCGDDGGTVIVQLNIRRRDGAPCHRDWRHFQRIKNEIVGEECEAIELYPAESRKVDTTNKYHLFACVIPGWRFPVGMDVRDVQDAQPEKMPSGLRQRPLQDGDK